MTTPLHDARRGHSDPQAVGDTLTATLLRAREALPLAENNKHQPLSDRYARSVVKDMSEGRSQEFKRIYAVCQCMLADGISLPLVTAALRQMLTMLEVESVALVAERRTTTPRLLPILLRSETRKQGLLDVAQLRVLETPDCPNTLSAALFAGEIYLAAYEAWAKALVALLHTVQHGAPASPVRIVR